MSFRERARRMLADIIHKGGEPWKPPPVAKQPPPPPAPSPLRIAAFGTLLALSERLKRTDRAGLASADALKDARWSGREIARAVKALLEGEPEGTRGASWRRASALLMSRWMAKQSAEPPPKTEEGAAPAPSRSLVEALYRLRRTLATDEQRDALRAVEAIAHERAAAPPLPLSPVPFGAFSFDVRTRAQIESERFAAHVIGGFRAKEMADHKAWLRDNADSVTVPEHPAVALLRDLHALRGCVLCGHSDECAEGCRLAAILAGSKPGERALSEVLAEEREKGRQEGANELLQTARKGARALDEEIATTPIDHALADLLAEERELGRREATFRATHEEVARKLAEARAAGYDEALQKAIAERNAMYSAHELGALADELDEDNNATAAKKLRAAIATIARLEAAAKEERAKGREEGRAEAMAQHGAIEQAAFQAGKTHGAREAFAACETIVKDHPEVNTLGQPLDVAGSKPFLIAAFRARGQR